MKQDKCDVLRGVVRHVSLSPPPTFQRMLRLTQTTRWRHDSHVCSPWKYKGTERSWSYSPSFLCHHIPRICVMHVQYAVIKPKPRNIMLACLLFTLLIHFCCYTTLLSLFPSYAERHRNAGILIPNSGNPQMQFQAERLPRGIKRIKSLREDLSTAGLIWIILTSTQLTLNHGFCCMMTERLKQFCIHAVKTYKGANFNE